MLTKFSDLRCKEVINVSTGQRLGFVCDADIDVKDGRILALIVPGPGKLGGILGREDDYVIPWGCICRMGEDIILVEMPGEAPRHHGDRGGNRRGTLI